MSLEEWLLQPNRESTKREQFLQSVLQLKNIPSTDVRYVLEILYYKTYGLMDETQANHAFAPVSAVEMTSPEHMDMRKYFLRLWVGYKLHEFYTSIEEMMELPFYQIMKLEKNVGEVLKEKDVAELKAAQDTGLSIGIG
jgi:hypothetical protein